MKVLRNYLDKLKPHFEEGGKLSKFHSVFEGLETFLFVPDTTSKHGVHIHDNNDSKRGMIMVVIALIPALLFGMYNTGLQHFAAIGVLEINFWDAFLHGMLKVLPLVIVSYGVGLGIEFIVAQIRRHEIQEGFLVSGMLIPLILPVGVPLWMVAVATAFAVIFAKEVFGGTGMNIFNVALVTRAFLFFAYPTKMSGDQVWIDGDASGAYLNGFSGATPLGDAASTVDLSEKIAMATEKGDLIVANATQIQMNEVIEKLPDWWTSFMGFIPGSIGETSTLAILIGALFLLFVGVASWKIMFSVFAGGLTMGYILNAFAVNPYMEIPAYQHLLLGGFAFGAVFMATDPVTATRTETGKWIYGFFIGFIAILLRVINPAYPEGMMLAILLMNTFAPLIDYYVVESNIKRRMKRARAVNH